MNTILKRLLGDLEKNGKSPFHHCTNHKVYVSTQQQVIMMIAGVEFYVLSLATQQFLHVMIPEYNDMIYDKYKFLI